VVVGLTWSVSIPDAIIPAVAHHLEQFAEPGTDGVVFVGPKGGPLRRGNFNTTWHALAREADQEGLRFHDLRHTGNTLTAMTGASTKEFMVRMGIRQPVRPWATNTPPRNASASSPASSAI
jgi:integrase